MTVILAALYDNGKGAIIMTDKMRTTYYGDFKGGMKKVQVQNNDIIKIFPINKYVTISYSGNVEFWSNVIDELIPITDDNDTSNIVREKIENVYRKYLQDWLVKKVLFYHNYIRYADYEKDVSRLHAEDPTLLNLIREELWAEGDRSPSELVVVARDGDVFKIYTLEDPGILNFSQRGYAALGSGAEHAISILTKKLRLSYGKEEVYKALAKAKKLAEQESDVGDRTDVLYLSVD
jgi:20S proteasome alpha/beta subunit